MKKIIVKIDVENKTVIVKRGLFCAKAQYSGGWWEAESMEAILEDFNRK